MHDRGEPLAHVVEDGRLLLGLEQAAGPRDRVVHRAHESALESLPVRSTVDVADGVGEALDGAFVARSPPERDLDLGPPFHIGLHDAVGVGGVLLVGAFADDELRAAHGAVAGGSEELDHVGQAVGVVEGLLVDRRVGGGTEHVRDTGHEERGVAQLRAHELQIERRALLEVAGVVPVADDRARRLAALHLPHEPQARLPRELRLRPRAVEDAGHPAGEGHFVDLAAALHRDVEPQRQRVDGRGAHTVQTAGRLVSRTAELAARVQPGEHQLDAAQPGLAVDVGRDAAPVVGDLDTAVGVQRDHDLRGVPRDALVGGVVDDLGEEMVDPATVGGPDVHAGPLAHRFETFEVREVVGPVEVLSRGSHVVALPGRDTRKS